MEHLMFLYHAMLVAMALIIAIIVVTLGAIGVLGIIVVAMAREMWDDATRS